MTLSSSRISPRDRVNVRLVVSLVALVSVVSVCQPACAAEATVGQLTFRVEDFNTSLSIRPFHWTRPAPVTGDATAAITRIIDGVPYDMALRQAEGGYRYLVSYRMTGNDWYLQKARAQADHLIAVHITEGEGWFYPSTFRFALDGKYGGGLLQPPWYSGIAQGAAVGFFARMWQATGDPAYRDAADHTFESFLVPSQTRHPWISLVDNLGYLHAEEYPNSRWLFVFNGHMEAAMGLFEYYQVTHDVRALSVYRGTLNSVLAYGDRLRNPGWASAYSLGARAPYVGYHRFVGMQLLQLYSMSGDVRFVHLAHSFDDDYPLATTPGKVWVIPGVYSVYRFDARGAVTATKLLRVSMPCTYNTSTRGRITGRAGYWMALHGGRLDGYYLREVTDAVYYRGAIDILEYSPGVRVGLRSGQWLLQQVDPAGNVVATRRALFAPMPSRSSRADTSTAQLRPSAATIRKRAVVNGQPSVLLESGPYQGFWAPQRAVVLP